MNVIEIPRHPAAPVRRRHTPLAAINPGAPVARAARRVTDTPDRPPARPITFDSAL
ncbi:hypothetical protein ACFYNA_15350 [Streptomyces sp. NPDC006640]|uniref:hypothetical protein n=1 Tax=Streptomyces sp. NPDC006640 TaxID=3364754 RepID=UPI003690E462